MAAGLGCWEDSVGITPLILRPFGRSGQELPVEYQVEPHFINFSASTAKKGYRQGPGSGNLEESLLKAMISQR